MLETQKKLKKKKMTNPNIGGSVIGKSRDPMGLSSLIGDLICTPLYSYSQISMATSSHSHACLFGLYYNTCNVMVSYKLFTSR